MILRDEDDDKEMMKDDQSSMTVWCILLHHSQTEIESISDVLNNSDDSNP